MSQPRRLAMMLVAVMCLTGIGVLAVSVFPAIVAAQPGGNSGGGNNGNGNGNYGNNGGNNNGNGGGHNGNGGNNNGNGGGHNGNGGGNNGNGNYGWHCHRHNCGTTVIPTPT
ncbi:hypothetical protein, partial [Rhodococcus sp. SB1D]